MEGDGDGGGGLGDGGGGDGDGGGGDGDGGGGLGDGALPFAFAVFKAACKAAFMAAFKAAKEKAAKAKAEAMDEANKAEVKTKKSAAVKQAGSKQKIKKQAATEKQKAAAAPAKEDAPVKRSTVSFPGTRVVFVIAALFFAITMALRSNSSTFTSAAEVVTPKSIFSWANDQQCGLYDNNDSCAAQEAFKTTCSVRLFFRHLNPLTLTPQHLN